MERRLSLISQRELSLKSMAYLSLKHTDMKINRCLNNKRHAENPWDVECRERVQTNARQPQQF